MIPLALLLVPCPLPAQAPATTGAGGAVAEHRIAGSEAWEAARHAGFQFRPVAPDDGYILAGAPDGVRTVLKACVDPLTPCVPEAEVAKGGAVVFAPACDDGCVRVHTFELFAGRSLAAGWTVAEVEIEGTGWSWHRRPRAGDRVPAFTLRVEARSGAEGRARVRSITLYGPPGAGWTDAFRIF